MTTHQDPVREALAELVAIDNLKKSLAQAGHHAQMFPTDENYAAIDELQTDLNRRRLPAWEAARAALASTQVAAPLQAGEAPHQALQEAGGWISVEKRLPPKHTEVLVALEGVALACTGQYTGSDKDHDGWCYPRENCDWFDGTCPQVLYWRELPDVPGLGPDGNFIASPTNEKGKT